MATRGLIELGDVSAGDSLPVAAPPPRRITRTAAVLLGALVCAATLTSSAVPQSHGPRLSWTMASARDTTFTLTAGSLIVHPLRGSPAAGPAAAGPTAYDLADGSPLWSAPMPGGEYLGAWPADDALLMPLDGDADVGGLRDDGTSVRSTAALDVATGAWRWRIAGDVSMAAHGLAVVEVPNGRTGRPAALRAVRVTDGRTVWSRPLVGGQTWTHGTDRLVAVAEDGTAEVVRLSDGSTVARGRLARQAAAPEGMSSTMVLTDGDALQVSEDSGDRQVVTAYDLDTLRRRWRIERPAGGTIAPCGTVLCVVDAAATVAHDPATGAVRWRVDGWTVPWPIGPGRLLVSSGRIPAGHVTVDAGTGEVLADHGPGTAIGSAPESLYFLGYTREPTSRVSVSRLDPRTGRTRLLGTVGLVVAEQCQANATHLVCPRTDGTLTVTDLG